MRAVSSLFLVIASTCAVAAAACGDSNVTTPPPGAGAADGGGGTGNVAAGGNGAGIQLAGSSGNEDGGAAGGSGIGDLGTLKIVLPGKPELTVVTGKPIPTLKLSATVEGRPVTVGWSVDRGELGSIDQNGLFTPTGTQGGTVTIRVGLAGKVVEVKVLIRVQSTQNGPTAGQSSGVVTDAADLGKGGGVLGVGGEGLGGKITDAAALTALKSPTGDGKAQSLELLYPYEGTVFPRGLLAPLLMWRWTPGDADAVRVTLKTSSGSYAWTGDFGRPAILTTTGGKFIRHPIPQDVWRAATQSAGEVQADGTSDALDLELTLASGGLGYGVLKRRFYVAPGKLTGVVYYNSYGTALVTNTGGIQDFNKKSFGAAVLGIHPDQTSPTVVVGPASTDDSGCRVCHTVSAKGASLLVQGGGSDKKSWLKALADVADVSGTYLTGQDGKLGWAGLSPDGRYALTNAVDLSQFNRTVNSGENSALYDLSTTPPTKLTGTGLPADLKAALPTFSADGKQVAFAYLGGGAPFEPGLPVDGSQLAVMDFDVETKSFSNPKIVAIGNVADDGWGAGFPSFTPDGASVVFENEVRGNGDTYIGTRNGARGELWWTDIATANAVALEKANGKGYLPTGPSKHGAGGDEPYDDSSLNYEPTVNPITTGGFAWVVFTSRRMYGNVANGDPWLSDPRSYDATDLTKTTTKKLWVAAIDLNAKPGTDPSHPAFYLPGQELLAGNARGFWVLDPCASDGATCESGDQCCGGFCQPNGKDGALICSNETTTRDCSKLQEKCSSASDCCDASAKCIGGFCAQSTPRPPIK